ncbi:MAG TPA: universal stress protein [Desulfobulbus sp.]|nr:universal stress protein [Desulfobulbus sp.]
MVEIKKVVVPVDFTSIMDKVVDYATSVADKLGAHVTFFHVVNDFQGYDMLLVHPSFGEMTKELREKSEQRMADLVQDYKHLKAGVSGKVVVGDAAEEIIKFAEQEKADMIIIGTHGVKGLEKILMGSTAEKVVKKAPCPVLTFNPYR